MNPLLNPPRRIYPGWMRRARSVTQAAISLAARPLTVIFSLVIPRGRGASKPVRDTPGALERRCRALPG